MATENDVEMLPLLSEHDITRITVMSVASVRRWRLLSAGPRYLKIGAAVRYRLADVKEWRNSRPSGGEPLVREEVETATA